MYGGLLDLSPYNYVLERAREILEGSISPGDSFTIPVVYADQQSADLLIAAIQREIHSRLLPYTVSSAPMSSGGMELFIYRTA